MSSSTVAARPRATVAAIREVLRPGGTLSLLVAQRHAAVVARAMAGHFGQAREVEDGRDPEREQAEQSLRAAQTLERLRALRTRHGERFAPRPGWDSPALRADTQPA